MSSIKQRLEDATQDIDDIKDKVHDLPDYPDLQNTYGNADITEFLTNIPSAVTTIYDIQEETDFIIYSANGTGSSSYKVAVYKYNKSNNTHTLLYNCTSNYGVDFLHYYNNKLYFVTRQYSSYDADVVRYVDLTVEPYALTTLCNWSGGKFYLTRLLVHDGPIFWYAGSEYNGYNTYSGKVGYFNVTTGTKTELLQICSDNRESCYFIGDNYCTRDMPYWDLHELWKYEIDVENKTATKVKVINNYSNVGALSSTTISPIFVNIFNNKVVLRDSRDSSNIKLLVKPILNDGTLGDTINTINTNLSVGYFTKYNLFYSGSKVYNFNETDNDFTEKYINNAYPYNLAEKTLIFSNSQHLLSKLEPNQQYIVGFKYNNKSYSTGYTTGAVSNKVLVDTEGIRDYNGQVITGTMPNNGALSYTPTTSQQTIPEGYTSGGTIDAVDSSIDSNITQANIRAGVTILGIEGNLEPDKPDQTKTCTPSTSQQVIEPDTGYELASVTVSGVTSAIDSNITAGNIKKDVEILGVTGTYEPEPNVFAQDIKTEEWNTTKMTNLQAIPSSYINISTNLGTDIYLMTSNGADMYKYDTITDTYTQLSAMTATYSNFTNPAFMIGIDNIIYIFGQANGNNPFVCKYDITNDTYSYKTFIDSSAQFSDCRGASVGTDIYIFSYSNGLSSTYKYNTVADSFSSVTRSPVIIQKGSAVAIGTDIYLLGGQVSAAKVTNYKYNTLTNTYTQLTNIPYTFYGGSAVAIGTDIYLFGSDNTSAESKNCYKYNVTTDTYIQLANIPDNFRNRSASTVNDDIYLFGGENYPTKVQVMSLVSVEPTSKEGIWLKTNKTVSNIVSDTNVYLEPYWNTEKYGQLPDTPYTFNGRAFITSVGTDIYFFGEDDTENKVYKLDTILNIYTSLTDLPVSLGTYTYGGAASIGTDIYIFVGGVIYKYDTVTDTYTQMNTTLPANYNSQRQSGGHYICSIGTNIWVGLYTNYGYKMYKYDTLNDTITEKNSISKRI